MKLFKNYMSTLVVFALLLTSCSKEESSALDDADANFVELTFGATLNDLANRAANKGHFDDIPTCADTAPDYAVISFSYGGNDYEATVDILSDSDGYFTDYSELLKIPVSANGTTNVTLTGFLVYDSSNTIIWAAPIGAEFANYVDQVLPRSFNVAAGTKPYIDVEVLCFDRRLVNEYGYVFFDIVPETIYPLCTFINYCNEDGRHWVANYSVDLYFGPNANGIQLYDNEDNDAQVAVGMRNGQYYADPLCLVVPGPPANLADDQPYLYMVIYPNDWTGNYGDINNSPIPVQLSWNDVEELLNSDGTSNEYLHLSIGECEGALSGDGSIGECDPANPSSDCDNDGTPNRCDTDNANYNSFDCDNDSFDNEEDNCPTQAGVAGGDGGDGCPAQGGLTCEGDVYNFGSLGDCQFAYINGNSDFVNITGEIPLYIAYSGQSAQNSVGALTARINAEDDLEVSADLTGITNVIVGYEITVTDGETYCESYSIDLRPTPGSISDEFVVNITDQLESLESGDISYPFQIMVKAIICSSN